MTQQASQAQASQAQAASLVFVNGQLVQANELKANYDGKHLAIDINKNGQHFAKILNNKDIERILAQPAHKLSLDQRLQRDFLGLNMKKTKNAKNAKNAKKSKKSKKSKTLKKRK